MIALMPRTTTTFESGNKVGLKLTDETRELFLATIRQTGRLSIAAGRCCVGARTVRGWLQKGREENAEEPYKSFADDVERARAEFLAVAARRMGQMAIGGVLNLPKYDKLNQLVRGADGEIEWEERYFPPNVNALAHVLDRIDPMPNPEPPAPDVPEPPELSDEAQVAQGLANYALIKEAIGILVDLGVPRDQIPEAQHVDEFEARMRASAIETTSTAAPAEPEPASDVTQAEPATLTDPAKSDPIESF